MNPFRWRWGRRNGHPFLKRVTSEVRLGLALGGGFARGVAHVGILKVLEREKIPLHCICGVSAGAIIAAAYASGRTAEEIGQVGASMRFGDVARWTISKMGLMDSRRMSQFLERLLKKMQFEDMQIPLGVVATDLRTGKPYAFRDHGDVAPAIRASCSYPGLFTPAEVDGRTFVDGAITVEVPAGLAHMMGATHVIAGFIPNQDEAFEPHNMAQVINRSFQIMMSRSEEGWRRHSDLVIMPDVGRIPWDGFQNAKRMIEAGEAAAEAALPEIRNWLKQGHIRQRWRSGVPNPGSLTDRTT